MVQAPEKRLVSEAALAVAKDELTSKLSGASLSELPVFLYGNSMAVRVAPWVSADKHYSDLLVDEMDGGAVTSYAIGGTRTPDVTSALVNGSALPGLQAPLANSKWPGTAARKGILIWESQFNDEAHYPNMTVPVAQPAALPAGNNNYINGILGAMRLALALMSSEAARIENTAFTGASVGGIGWTPLNATYLSGASAYFADDPGAWIEFSVKPPQEGPYAGKVFVMDYLLDPSVGTSAITNISVDGGAPIVRTPTPWEQYVGKTGTVNIIQVAYPLTLPVDGNAHTVRFTHAGSVGHLLYSDAIIMPSNAPNPILCPQASVVPLPHASVFTEANIEVWKQNHYKMEPLIKALIAEFPNAHWVPDTGTQNGQWSGDGLHKNDRGNEQRKNDLKRKLQSDLSSWLRNYAESIRPDSDFAEV